MELPQRSSNYPASLYSESDVVPFPTPVTPLPSTKHVSAKLLTFLHNLDPVQLLLPLLLVWPMIVIGSKLIDSKSWESNITVKAVRSKNGPDSPPAPTQQLSQLWEIALANSDGVPTVAAMPAPA